MKTAVIALADGFEEIEALTPVDLLRRAGIKVHLCGLTTLLVRSSRDIRVQADMLLSQCEVLPDALVFPGGRPGAVNLSQSKQLKDLAARVFSNGGILAAICASPSEVLAPWGYLTGKKACGFPGTEDILKAHGALACEDRVVVDLPIITSRAMGTSGEFGLALVRALAGEESAAKIGKATLIS
jgi:4-methyl-5(b-hydroxyethyl)-thiazole monophosphate biosynthesis